MRMRSLLGADSISATMTSRAQSFFTSVRDRFTGNSSVMASPVEATGNLYSTHQSTPYQTSLPVSSAYRTDTDPSLEYGNVCSTPPLTPLRATSLPTGVSGSYPGWTGLTPSPTGGNSAYSLDAPSPTRSIDTSLSHLATTSAYSLPSMRRLNTGSPPASPTDSGYSSMQPSRRSSICSSPRYPPTEPAHGSLPHTSPPISEIQHTSLGAVSLVPVPSMDTGWTHSLDPTIGRTPPAQRDKFNWTSLDRSPAASLLSTAKSFPFLPGHSPRSAAY